MGVRRGGFHAGADARILLPADIGDRVALYPSLLLSLCWHADIRELDLERLKARGITGVVFDKDNCLVRDAASSMALLACLAPWLTLSMLLLIFCPFGADETAARQCRP